MIEADILLHMGFSEDYEKNQILDALIVDAVYLRDDIETLNRIEYIFRKILKFPHINDYIRDEINVYFSIFGW